MEIQIGNTGQKIHIGATNREIHNVKLNIENKSGKCKSGKYKSGNTNRKI